MANRWEVRKDGKPVASGPVDTMYPDELVRQMAAAGYKTYVDGKLYKPGKKSKEV